MANRTLGVGGTPFGKISFRPLPNGNVQAKARIRFEIGGKLYPFTAQGADNGFAEAALKAKLLTATEPVRKRRPIKDVDGVTIRQEFTTAIEKIEPETLVRDAIALWLRSIDGDPLRRAQTRDAYRQTARQSLLLKYGNTEVGNLDAGRLKRYFTTLAQNQPSLARRARWMLQQVLADAVLDKALPHNLVMDTPKVKRPEHEQPEVLSIEDFQQMRQLIVDWRTARAGLGGAQRDRSFVLTDVVEILGGTALRINELLGLRHFDVDYEQGTVAVCGTLVELEGLGLKFQPKTKTPAGMRTITLPRFALDALHRQANLNGHPEYIFSTGTENFVNSHNIARSWRAARADSTLVWVEMKTLRASVATWIEDEAGLAAASAQLGHVVAAPEGSKVTAKYYIGKKGRKIVDNSGILGELVGPNVANESGD
ncbi:tyrosine-type recombinase/integrase [Cryobacterium sp. Y62]|uniref:tyrosine-type recombinase/integrase n=1 Tax=Cryobacterium sp. Y62 TaxID=2048284 RepID=UPI000CE3AA76|nr:tyrosine-type recombinase/integrase [Cryobacterium sp. Y62]